MYKKRGNIYIHIRGKVSKTPPRVTALPPCWGKKNPHEVECGMTGQVKQAIFVIPSFETGIIEYSESTLNAYSLLSHKWWVPLITYMMGPTTYVREGNTYLMYSRNIL